jgi:uncharacterized protein YegL
MPLLEKYTLPFVDDMNEQEMNIFFVIDTSDSMKGKMGMINTAMEMIVPSIKNMARIYNEVDIKLAIVSFASEIKWHTEGLIDINNFEWNPIEFGGCCDLRKVFKELGTRFLRKHFTKRYMHYPVIILISNGNTIDGWNNELEKLEKNSYFKRAIKVSIALGTGVFKDVLQRFASMDTVLIPHNISILKRIIKYAVIPRILNVECCAGEDGGYQVEPWMVWNDHFFQENYNYGHEHIGWYFWNKHYYQEKEDVVSNDIEIYRKRADDLESWWEEQKYNPILDECIVYKINVKKNSSSNNMWE